MFEHFFSSREYAVIGASNDRSKYGNKVLRCLMQHQKKVWPVNPNQTQIEGLDVIKTIAELPARVNSISIITPAHITVKVVQEAIAKGIQNIWMQPGAESEEAIALCQKNHINWIAQGPCILVHLGFHDQ